MYSLFLVTCFIFSANGKPAVNLNRNGYVSNLGLNKNSQSYQNGKVLINPNFAQSVWNQNYASQIKQAQQNAPKDAVRQNIYPANGPQNINGVRDPTAQLPPRFSETSVTAKRPPSDTSSSQTHFQQMYANDQQIQTNVPGVKIELQDQHVSVSDQNEAASFSVENDQVTDGDSRKVLFLPPARPIASTLDVEELKNSQASQRELEPEPLDLSMQNYMKLKSESDQDVETEENVMEKALDSGIALLTANTTVSTNKSIDDTADRLLSPLEKPIITTDDESKSDELNDETSLNLSNQNNTTISINEDLSSKKLTDVSDTNITNSVEELEKQVGEKDLKSDINMQAIEDKISNRESNEKSSENVDTTIEENHNSTASLNPELETMTNVQMKFTNHESKIADTKNPTELLNSDELMEPGYTEKKNKTVEFPQLLNSDTTNDESNSMEELDEINTAEKEINFDDKSQIFDSILQTNSLSAPGEVIELGPDDFSFPIEEKSSSETSQDLFDVVSSNSDNESEVLTKLDDFAESRKTQESNDESQRKIDEQSSSLETYDVQLTVYKDEGKESENEIMLEDPLLSEEKPPKAVLPEPDFINKILSEISFLRKSPKAKSKIDFGKTQQIKTKANNRLRSKISACNNSCGVILFLLFVVCLFVIVCLGGCSSLRNLMFVVCRRGKGSRLTWTKSGYALLPQTNDKHA